jgi:glycine/D-amino acid oxidase-like deaminating enzyme
VLQSAGIATLGTAAGAIALNTLAPKLWPQTAPVDPNKSYWAAALPAAGQALQESIDVDVAIVGGGLTGLATAFYLRTADPGRRVALFEARVCGNGASARNGAMLLTSTADRWMIESDHPELDRRIYDLTVENIGRIRELASRFGHDIELETLGAAQTLNDAGLVDDARNRARRLSEQGMPLEFWTADEVAGRLGTRRYSGALFDPASGQLHPGKLVALFKAAATAAGVEIYENTAIHAVDEGPIVTLSADAGLRVRAPAVVLGTNAYSSRLDYLQNDYASIVEYVGITAPLPADLLASIGGGIGIPFNDSRLEVYYLGPTRDGRLRIGGGPIGYAFNNGTVPLAPPAENVALLARELGRIYPALASIPFERTWAGAVDYSMDASPALGQFGRHRNIYYAIGYSGHGLNLTSVFGRILADLVLARGDQWRWLPFLNRHPPYLPNEPFRWLAARSLAMFDRAFPAP